jgi:EAL domain-containing protein (putative c-di-GMP-specific phosphodiesterase class I)
MLEGTTHLGYFFNTFKRSIEYFFDYNKQLKDNSKKQYTLEQIINHRLVDTYFQPIISLNDESLLGYEALNRPLLMEPFLSTENFYDYVGHSKTLFEMEKVCRNLAIQRFNNLNKNDTLDQLLFINVNPLVLSAPTFASGKTLEFLEASQIHPNQIVLEITEKGAVDDFEQFVKALNYYKKQGFKIAVDDTGAGYNSLKTLVYVQPDYIKLDRSLIQGLSKNPAQQAIVDLLLDYSERSKTKLIAEGIEAKEDYVYLKKLGLHFGQGYFISKPSRQLINTSLTIKDNIMDEIMFI